jgi:peptide/nickel transport system substrate-binding protein
MALKLVATAGSLGVLNVLAACGPAGGTPRPTDAPAAKPTLAAPAVPAAAQPTTAAQPAAAAKPAAGAATGSQPDKARLGGSVKVALYSEPPTLDSTWTTGVLVVIPSQHVFEYLLVYNSKWEPTPMLADAFEVGDGAKSYTFRLRQGVTFHNGKPLSAEDVVASLNRWGQLSSQGKTTYKQVRSVTATDATTVRVDLAKPFTALLNYLAGPTGGGAIIMPKEIAEKAGTERLTEYVGTGPYRFVEHVPDRHIKLARFDRYAARGEAPDAYAGRRTAYLDEVLFVTVPDAAARIAGVETGTYHWAEEVTRDEYSRLKESRDLEPIVIKPLRYQILVFNKKRGPLADVRLRQAVLSALDNKEIMAAAFGPQDFWRLDPSLAPVETAWHSSAGSDRYNTRSLDQARQLVKDSGYAGEKIRWIAPPDREDYFAVAVTGTQYLKQIGLNVEVVATDWGALLQQRAKPEEYEIFNTGTTFDTEPTALSFLADSWPGWWVSDKKTQLISSMLEVADFQQRKQLLDQLQQLVYEEVPVVKLGDFFGLTIKRRKLNGENNPVSQYPSFWNRWLDK